MIRSLRIQGFKAWRDTGRFELAPITALFGTNSSGKSSILHMLLLLKKTADSPDRSLVLDFGDVRQPPALGSFTDVLYAHDPSIPMGWELTWDLSTQMRIQDASKRKASIEGSRLTQRASIALREDGPSSNALSYGLGGSTFTLAEDQDEGGRFRLRDESGTYRLRLGPGRPPTLPGPVKSYGFPDEVKAYFNNASFLADFELEFERLMAGLLYLGPLREYPQRTYTWGGQRPSSVGERGERVVDVLLASQRSKETVPSLELRTRPEPLLAVVAHWLKQLELIHDFRVEEIGTGGGLYQVRVQKSPTSASVLLTDVGFGVSQILPVIVQAFAAPPGATVILEQPEIHLHPAVQAGLADVLVDASKRKNIQFIVESHSEHFLQRLQLRVAEELLPPADARLYFARTAADGIDRTLESLQLDRFGNITNWPIGFFGDRLGEAAAMAKSIQRRRSKSA